MPRIRAPSSEAAVAADVVPTLDDLRERWYGVLSGPQAAIMRVLVEVYPDDIAKSDLAEGAGASAISSGYTNNLGRLRALGLLHYPATGRVVATALLFPEGLA